MKAPVRFWGIFLGSALALAYVLLGAITDKGSMLLLGFWVILPLVNAPLDWLSLGVTRGLLNAIRSGHHGAGFVLFWTGMDLAVALLFMALITVVTTAAIALVSIRPEVIGTDPAFWMGDGEIQEKVLR